MLMLMLMLMLMAPIDNGSFVCVDTVERPAACRSVFGSHLSPDISPLSCSYVALALGIIGIIHYMLLEIVFLPIVHNLLICGYSPIYLFIIMSMRVG